LGQEQKNQTDFFLNQIRPPTRPLSGGGGGEAPAAVNSVISKPLLLP
jgi:hypothetical protein